jgi:geranylgeranyl diphosphate synthase type I
MSAFSPSLEDLRGVLDLELARFLGAKRDQLEEAAPLIDEIARLIEAGGKRLRPSFCYWGFRAANGAHSEQIVKAATSLELLHTFAIVHDDIMDVSDERRGMPTTFAKHGVNTALLVGDLALVLADAAFMESGFEAARCVAAFEHYSRMRQEVIAGQFLDVDAASRELVTVEEARRIAVLKSGRYSIEEPLCIGAALAGASSHVLDALAAFGDPLGEAFQLRDDLLGTFGERANVGKPVDSDIREGKRHVLYAETVRAIEGPDRDFFLGRWGAGDALDGQEVDRLRSLIESSGARTATEGLLDELRKRAEDELAALTLDDESRAALEELVRRATDRTL